jgi:Fe-S-cluster containining protein
MKTYLGDGLGSFGVLSNLADIDEQIKYLENAYSELPKTVGCTSEGTCCKVQHPHCYYIEFVYMMKHIVDNWPQEKRYELHIKCTENYLNNDINKQCIFLTDDMRCDIHKVRDFNCRSFGIIPEDAYRERYKKKKKEFNGKCLSLKRQKDCCLNVAPESFISQEKLDDIFNKIYEMDKSIGVDKQSIENTDNYMTFHDHYMLHCYSSSLTILESLTEVKKNGTKEDKVMLLQDMAKSLGVDYEQG